MATPGRVPIALATAPFARFAAEVRTTDPIFAAIKAHQTAWDLACEASDDDIDALMAAEANQLGRASKNDADHECWVRSNDAVDRDV